MIIFLLLLQHNFHNFPLKCSIFKGYSYFLLYTWFRYWTHFARKFSQNCRIQEKNSINRTNNLLAEMKLELIPSDYLDKNCECLPQFSLVRCYSKLFKQKHSFWDKYLSLFWKNNHFFMIFCRNALCFKVILAFCLMHVFAIEHTLQENLVRTVEFRRKIVSIERKFAGKDEIRTDTVWLLR